MQPLQHLQPLPPGAAAARGSPSDDARPGPAPIAIVSAMREEMHTLAPTLVNARVQQVGGRLFHHGEWAGQSVVLVLAGIGKVAAATTTTLLLARFGVRAVLFTGVAGGLGDGVQVGDVVVADTLMQHDMDASPLFPRYEVPLTGRTRFATDAHWSARLADAAHEALPRLASRLAAHRSPAHGAARVHRGLVISGDRFVSTAAESTELRRALPLALAVEMEGAAAAQVCAEFDCPFALLRTISDRADDAASTDFPRFIADVASEVTHAVLLRALVA